MGVLMTELKYIRRNGLKEKKDMGWSIESGWGSKYSDHKLNMKFRMWSHGDDMKRINK